MNLEVQWFIAVLVRNEVISQEEALELWEELGGESVQIEDYAQAILGMATDEPMSETEIQAIIDQMQQYVDEALDNAELGTAPELFAPPDTGVPFPPPRNPAGPAEPVPKAEAIPPPEESASLGAFGERITPEELFGSVLPSEPAEKEEAFPEPDGHLNLDTLPKLDKIANLSDEALQQLMMQLLQELRSQGASDLHLVAGAVPFVRHCLKLYTIGNRPLAPEDAYRLNTVLLNEEQLAKFQRQQDLLTATDMGHSRFRTSLLMHKDGIAGSYRLLPATIHPLIELGFLPPDIKVIEKLLDFPNGLILVTGPSGGGKTTTLASLVDIINHKRFDHIVAIKDPIEILHESVNCNITQREIGRHTADYHTALRAALREDPDIIACGELHDLETIENAVTAAETGHLVIGTLHTSDAANTLNRILDVFPPLQQPQVRAMAAGSLRGIICQRLLPALDGTLTVCYEILINTMAISNLIAEGKTHQLKAAMQTGSKSGMRSFDQCLIDKFKAGHISSEVAFDHMRDPEAIEILKQEVAIREAKKLMANRKKTR